MDFLKVPVSPSDHEQRNPLFIGRRIGLAEDPERDLRAQEHSDVPPPVPGGLTPSRMSPMFILMEAF